MATEGPPVVQDPPQLIFEFAADAHAEGGDAHVHGDDKKGAQGEHGDKKEKKEETGFQPNPVDLANSNWEAALAAVLVSGAGEVRVTKGMPKEFAKAACLEIDGDLVTIDESVVGGNWGDPCEECIFAKVKEVGIKGLCPVAEREKLGKLDPETGEALLAVMPSARKPRIQFEAVDGHEDGEHEEGGGHEDGEHEEGGGHEDGEHEESGGEHGEEGHGEGGGEHGEGGHGEGGGEHGEGGEGGEGGGGGLVDTALKAVGDKLAALGRMINPGSLPEDALASLGGLLKAGWNRARGLMPTDIHGPNLSPMLDGMRDRLLDAWEGMKRAAGNIEPPTLPDLPNIPSIPIPHFPEMGGSGDHDRERSPQRRRPEVVMPNKNNLILSMLLSGIYEGAYNSENPLPSRDYHFDIDRIIEVFVREEQPGEVGKRRRNSDDPFISMGYFRQLLGFTAEIPLVVNNEVELEVAQGLLAAHAATGLPPRFNCFELAYIQRERNEVVTEQPVQDGQQIAGVQPVLEYALAIRPRVIADTNVVMRRFVGDLPYCAVSNLSEEDRTRFQEATSWEDDALSTDGITDKLLSLIPIVQQIHTQLSGYGYLQLHDYHVPTCLEYLTKMTDGSISEESERIEHFKRTRAKLTETLNAIKFNNGVIPEDIQAAIARMGDGATVVDLMFINDVLKRQEILSSSLCAACPILRNCQFPQLNRPLYKPKTNGLPDGVVIEVNESPVDGANDDGDEPDVNLRERTDEQEVDAGIEGGGNGDADGDVVDVLGDVEEAAGEISTPQTRRRRRIDIDPFSVLTVSSGQLIAAQEAQGGE